MRRLSVLLAPLGLLLAGCASQSSYVHSEAALGRVVIYRNGIAYFERKAHVEGDTLRLAVPADKVDDFLKSLTVVDAKTGKPAPVSYPTEVPQAKDGLIDMNIGLQSGGWHDLRLSYVTEAPSWKPSYRVVLQPNGKVDMQAWAIVDNTSGEDWQNVELGVGSSSAFSFRFDLRSVRVVQRETLQADGLFALAPPTGGASLQMKQHEPSEPTTVSELDPETFRDKEQGGDHFDESKKDGKTRTTTGNTTPAVTARPGGGRTAHAESPRPQAGEGAPAQEVSKSITGVLRTLEDKRRTIVLEGFADPSDGDKYAASLERANRAREELDRNGADASRVVAVGRGEQAGRGAGVRVIQTLAGDAQQAKSTDAAEPIGSSHFESKSRMSVKRGTSAMVSILDSATKGEVVYYYDPETARGNGQFPFKAIRIQNPTDSVLESGPVTVFGEGKFVGEGLAEPIPAHATAFVPFALDRQIVIEKKADESDKIARVLTVQRGVFSTEVRHTRKTTLVLSNRLPERVRVYVRHTVGDGFALVTPSSGERLGAAYMFAVDIPASDKTELTIEEATPLYRTADVRAPGGMELVSAYLSSAALEGRRSRTRWRKLLEAARGSETSRQQISTSREAMAEYRTRMDELHAQVVTLRAVRTAGPLVVSLEKKLAEVSDRISKSTLELVALQEKLMVSRIRFQDGVADLSLEAKPASTPHAVASAPHP